jgi:hypothetical protein
VLRPLALLLVLVLAPGAAHGQKPPAKGDPGWAFAFRKPRTALFVDTAHVETLAGGAFRFWLRFDHAQGEPDPADSRVLFWSVQTQEIADCRTGRVTDVRTMVLDRSGRLLREMPASTRWRGATFDAHPFGREVFAPVCALLVAHQRRHPYPAVPRPGEPARR